jgi:peptidylprolyl isomerase/peptidyl-prolyl cis-trans isomerase D
MAVLGKIRSQGLILILVIALALFAFIIQGVLTSSGKSQDDAVGYVGDTEINQASFARQVDNMSRNGGPNMTTVQAVNSVWDQNVRNAILEEQIEAAGIEVTDQEVAERVKDSYRQNPSMINEDGSFSEAKFSTFVNQIQTDNPAGWSDFVESVASSLKQERFFNLIKSGIIGTNAEGEMQYRMANDNRSFSYVYIPYTTIADTTVEVSSGEIQKYINEHESRFKSEAQRSIEFVVFKDEASQADRDEVKTRLNLRKSLDNSTYNVNTKKTEEIKAFSDADDKQNYVNKFSDQPYNDMYQVASKLNSATKNAGGSLEVGSVFGPYEDGEFMKLSLVEDKRTIMDSVQNRHILVAYAGAERSMAMRSKEDAKRVADSILSLIGDTKATYDTKFEYFKENTEIAKGEDLGWTVYTANANRLAEGYRNFLYENDKGTIGIAESSFGYHIISIDDTRSPIDQVKLATIANKVSASKQTSKDLFTKAVKFQQAAETGDFAVLAKDNGVISTPVNKLKPLDESLPGIKKNRSIVKWAFESEREIGDVERFETTEGYVVVKLNAANEAGMMTTQEASATVTPILRKEKKAKLIMDKITKTDLNEIATAQGQSIRNASAVNRKNPTIPGPGEEPMVVGTVFGLEQDATSKPIKGENGIFIVKVTGIEKAADIENYSASARQAATQTANQSTTKLVEALKKSAKIEDNRADFY